MNKIQASMIVHQPVDQVFDFFCDPQKTSLWLLEPTEIVPLIDDPQRSASRYRKKVRGWANLTLETIQETTEFVPNQKYANRTEESHGWLISQSQWSFASVAEGTQITVDHDVELHSWLWLVGPMILPIARKKVKDDLIRLKNALEKN